MDKIAYLTSLDLKELFSILHDSDVSSQTKIEIQRLVKHGHNFDVGVIQPEQNGVFYTREGDRAKEKEYKVTLTTFSEHATMFLEKSFDEGMLKLYKHCFE